MSEFIGSVISLISKRDIRYKGTLHAINSENHTVALQNVYSYGTEGRLNGVDEVPPQEGLYEYIVFRGTDVKELSIEEPAPPKAAPIQQDPAIVDARMPAQQPPPPPGHPGVLGPGPDPNHGPAGYPGFYGAPFAGGPDPRFAPPPMGYPPYPPPQFAQAPPPVSQPSGPGPGSVTTPPTQQFNHQQHHKPEGYPAELGALANPQDSNYQSPTGGTQAYQQDGNQQSSPKVDQNRNDENSNRSELAELPTGPNQGYYNNSSDNNSNRGRGGQNRGNNGRRNVARNQNQNWEKSNSDFQEMALPEKPVSDAGAAPPVGEPSQQEVKVPAYDKGKSFFDNISSDLNSKEDGRDRQFRDNERRRNMETFGQGSIDSYRSRGGFHRGRGTGRGQSVGNGRFRGRGGYQQQ